MSTDDWEGEGEENIYAKGKEEPWLREVPVSEMYLLASVVSAIIKPSRTQLS